MYTDGGGASVASKAEDQPKGPDCIFEGYSAEEAIALFGNELTEFEKIEIKHGSFERIYTVGRVRRQQQHSLTDHEGHYKVLFGEQIGYRYEVTDVIDNGAFGQVI